jgi:hypothetical protein
MQMRIILFNLLLIPAVIFSQPRTLYQIQAELSAENNTVSGVQVITWTRSFTAPVTELYISAPLNAFRNPASSFYKQAQAADARHPWVKAAPNRLKNQWGALEIQAIRVQNDSGADMDVLSSLVPAQPDDGNRQDQTVYKIQLPAALTGTTVKITIEFTARLPFEGIGTGYSGKYFFAGHWFPQLSTYDAEGWHPHQFHLYGGRFSDYSDFDITLSAPHQYRVAASGGLIDSTSTPEKVSYHFQQTHAQDFVWAASPLVKLAKKNVEQGGKTVTLQVLYFPQHKSFLPAIFNALAAGLKYFGTWYNDFPYQQMTVIEQPWDDPYHTVFPGCMTTFLNWPLSARSLTVEKNIISGMAQQYWRGLVNTDGLRYPWLTDGLGMYSTFRCLDAAYGSRSYCRFYFERPGFAIPVTFPSVLLNLYTEPISVAHGTSGYESLSSSSWEFENPGNYPFNVYDKAARVFWTLEGMLGEETFGKVLKAVATEYKWQTIDEQAFTQLIERFAPQSGQKLVDPMIHGTGEVDYSVAQIVSNEILNNTDSGGNAVDVTTRRIKKNYASQVILHRDGDLHIPVDILITLENGESIKEQWDGSGSWRTIQFSNEAKISRVDIDAEYKLVLERNRTNNSRYYNTSIAGSILWTTRWLYWLQHFFEVIAIFS